MFKISVVIRVYKFDGRLERCLDNLFNQTLDEIEIFCITKESDYSSDIFSKYDNQVTFLNKDDDVVCRNKVVELVNGEYIFFMDSFDWLDSTLLEKLYANAKCNNSNIVLSGANRFSGQNLSEINYFKKDDSIDFNNFIFDFNYDNNLVFNKMNVILPKLYKTSFLRDKNICFNYDEGLCNVDFYIEAMFLSNKISYLPDNLYNSDYDEKIMYYNTINFDIIFNVFDKIEKFLIENNFYLKFKIPFLEFKIIELKNVLNNLEFKEDFYILMRKEFIKMNLKYDVLNDLSLNVSKLYINVLNNKTYFNFIEFEKKVQYTPLKYIHKKELIEKIKNFNAMGINLQERKESIIVSLTSFPDRMHDIHYCIYSLLNQDFKPDKIILWLANEQFPNKEEDIPLEVLKLKDNGLSIKWCDDLKSFKKIIPALEKYPDSYIVTADDDIFYPKSWLKTMWETYKRFPNTIISSRSRRIKFDEHYNIKPYNQWKLQQMENSSYLNFPTGAGGTLYFPKSLNDLVFNKSLFLELCPFGDDIWLWAMAILNKTRITSISNPLISLTYVNVVREMHLNEEYTLWDANQKGQNDVQFNNVLDRFPEIKENIIFKGEGFIFSIVMAVYNTERYLSQAIESIINQTFEFNKVQIILVDDGSTDNSQKICLNYVEKYPNNIKYIYQENQGQATARNNGLNYAEGDFINFLDSDDKLEPNALEEIYYHFMDFGNEIDVISIPRYAFGFSNGPLAFSEKYEESRIVDIEEEFNFPQFSISAAFIKKEALKYKFETRLIISEDSLMINKIILDKCKFGVVANVKYLYRKRRELNSTIDTKKIQKSYFSLRMELYFKELIDYSIKKFGQVPKYIQTVLISDLRWLFEQKTEIGVLNDDEKREYYNHIWEVLQYIDDELILSQKFNENLKIHMLNFKNQNEEFIVD